MSRFSFNLSSQFPTALSHRRTRPRARSVGCSGATAGARAELRPRGEHGEHAVCDPHWVAVDLGCAWELVRDVGLSPSLCPPLAKIGW